jgi:hypothetical protein
VLGDQENIPKWVTATVDAAHFVLPRYKDLDALTNYLLARDLLGSGSLDQKVLQQIYGTISWGESIGFSAGFIVLFLGLACWRFATKDY